MACKYYQNNGFNCSGCMNFVKSVSIVNNGTAIIITIPNGTYRNKCKLCIALVQNIPQATTTLLENLPVFVQIDGATDLISLLTPCGNRVWGDQLLSRKVLHTYILTDVPALKLSDTNSICPTNHNFPVLTAPTA